jgi:hypothetical protein
MMGPQHNQPFRQPTPIPPPTALPPPRPPINPPPNSPPPGPEPAATPNFVTKPTSFTQSEDDVKSYILRRLGYGIIDVELTDDMMQDVVIDTKRWFSFRIGQKKLLQIPLTTATNVYVLEPEVTEVLRVFLPTSHFPAVDTDDFSYTYSLLFGQWRSPGASPLPYSDLVQRLQYLNQSKKIFSADREWDYNRENHELLIMPRPSIVGNMLVEVWTNNIDTRELGPEDYNLFIRWAIAHSKELLGQMRAKWDSVPMVGGDKGMNGEKLIEESKAEKEQIEKDGIHWRRATPIIFE